MRSTHWPSLIFVPINEQLHTVVVWCVWVVY
jgi:hypothetical protein